MKKSSLAVLFVVAVASVSTASAQIIAQDDFSTYNAGDLFGQTGQTIDEPGGEIIGFGSVTGGTATAWEQGGATADTGAYDQALATGRINRAFDSSVSGISSGTVWIAFDAALGTGFSAVEVGATNDGSGDSAIRLFNDTGAGTFGLGTTNAAGGITFTDLGTYTTASHLFLLELNLTNDTVIAYQDPSTTAFDPSVGASSPVAVDPTFALDYLDSAAYSAVASVQMDNFRIADTAQEALTGVVPEPGTWAMMFGGLTLLVVVRRFRSRSVLA
jgi:hypothetical protein